MPADNTSNKWLVLFLVVIGTAMSALDSSIVNIAVAKFMTVFGASLDDVKWILTAYTLTLGAIVPLTGFLLDSFGNKRIFMFSLITFTAGSLLCGLAWSNSSMILFRIIQAIGGGLIMPVGMTMIIQAFPPNERGTALGFWGVASMAAPAIGPTLGGYIIQYLDWRLIFYLNIPLGIMGVIMAGIVLENVPGKLSAGFDYFGWAASTVGIVSILYVLGQSSLDWGAVHNPLLITLGCFSLLLFVFNELYHSNPLIELRVLKSYDYSISQIIQVVLIFAFMGGMYIMPLFLQSLRGFTAMQTGMIMLPQALASGLMMPISGKLYDKIGLKLVSVSGLCIFIASSVALALINLDTAMSSIILILTIRGFGLGLVMMPITTAGMNAVPLELAGRATALNNLIRQIAAALSVTIMTSMIQGRLNLNYERLSEQITPFNPTASGIIGQMQAMLIQNGYAAGEAKAAAISYIGGVVQKQAYVDAMDYVLAAAALVALLAIVLIIFMRSKTSDQTPTAQPAPTD
ncbi:MAG TPA: DHA2 family efflux MFS transporter permease subunit [Syntrophomonadaceae bacterium]|nr:DHA2 family efflux MFS transporter permease subunit [Syntrophomonadaceae bacterium]